MHGFVLQGNDVVNFRPAQEFLPKIQEVKNIDVYIYIWFNLVDFCPLWSKITMVENGLILNIAWYF